MLALAGCGKKPVVASPVSVESVELDATSEELTEGETLLLTATVLPENATDKAVAWTSSEPATATVAEGLVTAVKAGTAFIYARAGDKSASCKITVIAKYIPPEPVPVTSVSLEPESLTLKAGKTAVLEATVLPENADDKTVTWTSSDPSVASVAGGTVLALKAGTAVITAAAGDCSAQCTVSVSEDSSASGDPEPLDPEDWE